jgi:D-arabinose 1-dehydrogenase-like Zn-dependent alcohol dehydrogenase
LTGLAARPDPASGRRRDPTSHRRRVSLPTRRQLAGSLIGNLADTREVLNICAKHGIAPDIELIDIEDVNDAYRKVEQCDVRFRYVMDMATLEA